MTNPIKIIGIDPAPVKDSTIFDGEKFEHFEFEALKDYIDNFKESEDVLICWDAPLLDTKDTKPPYFKQIESTLKQLFYKGSKKKKGAEGVSILPFGTCPHWAISRYVLGLPRFSSYDKQNIPFHLLQSEEEKELRGRNIVEVHPAIALYYWSNKKLGDYKQSKASHIRQTCEMVKNVPAIQNLELNNIEPKNDDELDALAAYILGKLWISDTGLAKIYGNPEMGAMLLPKVDEIDKLFS